MFRWKCSILMLEVKISQMWNHVTFSSNCESSLNVYLCYCRSLLAEIQHSTADPEIEEKQGKLEQLKTVLEMYGHFSGINRKVQLKYQPRGRPRGSSSDDGNYKNLSLDRSTHKYIHSFIHKHKGNYVYIKHGKFKLKLRFVIFWM